MSRPRVATVVAVAVLAPWACANPTEATVDRRALARAQALWQSQGIIGYTIEARELCFCPPGMGEWMEITVRSGAVVSSRPVVAGGVYTASGPRRTVEQLFDFIDGYDGSGVQGARLEVEYDPDLGYPRSINLTAENPPPDFGLSIQARNLTRLQAR